MKFKLGCEDNGVFFWQDNEDPSQKGTLGTTDKQEAERLLNSKNHAAFSQWRNLEREWAVGDVVQLNSGGPGMTIVNVIREGHAYDCYWMSGNRLQKGYFPKATLQVPPAKKLARRKASQNPGKRTRKGPRA